jgi:hypothetical protein
MPFFRLPYHFSFVNVMGPWWYQVARALRRLVGQPFLNYAFHAVDILDRSGVPESIRYRPGLGVPTARKQAVMRSILADVTEGRETLTSIQAAHVYA